MSRLNWTEYFLDIACAISKRASCPRRSHGCVIVNQNKSIITCGYNGAPPDCMTCLEGGCLILNNHCKRSEHAERNALYRAAREGHSVDNCIAYITGEPCIDCLRALLSAGIKSIYFIQNGHYAFSEEEEKIRQFFINTAGIHYEPISKSV